MHIISSSEKFVSANIKCTQYPVLDTFSIKRSFYCRIQDSQDIQSAQKNESIYQCCSGFCIDLLQKFSEEIGFSYELRRVEDGKWGTLEVSLGKIHERQYLLVSCGREMCLVMQREKITLAKYLPHLYWHAYLLSLND